MSRYLIFGGTGSLGRRLIQRLLPENEVVVCSRDESKHWTIKNELANHSCIKSLSFCVGDIRDFDRVRDVIRQSVPQTIIVAAALKHVDTCEYSPGESILTNLIGTQNVVDAVNELVLSRINEVLFVSTDKACAPVNVYGMCKAISERVIINQASVGHENIKFLCVRYGNVLESRGSIIPLFKHQAENSEVLTVTDPEMTRFLMTLDNSVDLIQHALRVGTSGETWIPKLHSMKIGDLARIFAEKSGKQVKIIGLRPGEKKHEDLINESESVRTRAVEGHYVIDSIVKSTSSNPRFTYSSNDAVMSKEALETHLTQLGIFEMPISKFIGSTVEEIMTNRK